MSRRACPTSTRTIRTTIRCSIRHRLTEIEPGLFLAENGETLDFRGPVPTWRSVDLVRVTGGPAPWQWALLAASAVVSVWWLIAALVSTIRRGRRGREAAEESTARHPIWRLLVSAAAALTSILALGTIALLVALPGLVDSGFLGWLETQVALRLAFHLPLALAAAAGCLVVLTVFGSSWAWRTQAVPVRFVALVIASVALTAQLAAWRLIGLGI